METDIKISVITSKLLTMFEQGTFPPAAARTVIARITGVEKPCSSWSFLNQLIVLMSGTDDARGYRQWQEVNRYVTKGAKAVYILVPLTMKTTIIVSDLEFGESREETRHLIKGFKTAPVFRYEDTDGNPIPDHSYDPPQLPPLYEVAKHFGMVRYSPKNGGILGSCSQSGTITLYSHDIDVFFHELGHQVHNSITPLKGGQHTDQELVAEMVSCVLCEMYGFQGYQWQGWEYMQAYTDCDPVNTIRSIGSVLNDVETVICKIISVDAELQPARALA